MTLARFLMSTEEQELALAPSTHISGEAVLEAFTKTLLSSRDCNEPLIESIVKIETQYRRCLQSFLNGVVKHVLSYTGGFLVFNSP